MYGFCIKTITYPVGLPEDLYGEIKDTAEETKLSMADAIRQGLRLGLPKLRETLGAEAKLKPLSRQELRDCYSKPNREFDALEHHCAALPKPLPEED